MVAEAESSPHQFDPAAYAYLDGRRYDILGMIPSDGHSIGSIGCGMAWAEGQIVKEGRKVHGVDVSPIPIRVAAQRLTSARVISAEEREPFAPHSLDGLILADVLEHIPKAWVALESFVKSVRPGGWVVISVPNMRSPLLLQFIIRGDWPERPSGIFDATHVQVLSRKRLERWCKQANLRIERWYDNYGPPKYHFALADLVTLRRFHSWFCYQLQCVCRVER
jgi:2-polyprenyl-3-methyl-5-hydroxy-6-metoxy-1,4-benzoquinol methylase